MAIAGIAALLLSLALAAIFPLEAQAGEIDMCPAPVASADIGQETIEAPGLPNFGKWMLDHTGSPAHWLGEIYQGKKLREPINVVIAGAHATSVADAKERVVEASARAGYTIRMGHSSGYRALIAGEPHEQLPAGWDDAFSNHLFEVTNNHGRMFGPFQQGPSYILIGAFSREEVSLLHWPEHRMRVGVDDVDARRAQTGDDKVPAPEEGMASERQQGRAAGVPAEVVELVPFVRHRDRVHKRSVSARAQLHIDHAEGASQVAQSD
jgi:hypothetical protein